MVVSCWLTSADLECKFNITYYITFLFLMSPKLKIVLNPLFKITEHFLCQSITISILLRGIFFFSVSLFRLLETEISSIIEYANSQSMILIDVLFLLFMSYILKEIEYIVLF